MTCVEPDYVQWSLEPLDTVDDRSAGAKGRSAGTVGSCGEGFKLEKAYLRSSASLTMAGVKAYLSQKFCLAAHERGGGGAASYEDDEVAAAAVAQARAIELFTRRRQQMNSLVAVADEQTLRDVCLQYWDGQSELNLFFRIDPVKS
jgi:hypothetical protein